MIPKQARLFATIFMAGLLCILAGVGFARIAQKGSEGQAPIKVLRIVIDVNQREELFDRLREFAGKHGFELFIREVEVIPKGVFIEMYRDDLKILAGDSPSDPTMIDLGIYERDLKHPTAEETVDELFNDLNSFLSEIPNVTIVEKN